MTNDWSTTLVFSGALAASLAGRLWLATRQMRHVAAHRNAVPPPFERTVSLDAHRKAADYTLAKVRFGMLHAAFGAAVVLGWTLLGGLDALNAAIRDAVEPRAGALAYELALIAAFSAIAAGVDLPFEAFSIFRIEQRFGFNRTTPRLFASDLLKGALLSAVVGGPLAVLVLWIMGAAGASWWLWAWGAWAAFSLAMSVVFPTWIAPLFNRFEPLADRGLADRVTALMRRCGFAASGLFVMDGSRRSAHANAYFTGLGASKRVVFFDTLLKRLDAGEVEAVLAHELGHFHHRHVLRRIVLMLAMALAAMALLGALAARPWFYEGLGVAPNLAAPNDALALLLFLLAVPPFAAFAAPAGAALSRHDEFEADAYAGRQANRQDLASALLKLQQDNAGTLTPDPVYARVYYSHPPTIERLAAMNAVSP